MPGSTAVAQELELARTRDEVRRAVAAVRAEGLRIALVPTMGSLHEGHLALIDRAREVADWVAVSVFVNPLQFGPTEDLDRYPRDLGRDLELAHSRGADLVFAPSVDEMYPDGEPWVAVVPERGADRLCGASRPGHFRGVLTVVAKLFGIVRPDVAIFGQKDFQQVVLVRRMVRDLDLDVVIETVPIIRETDGLALSSRNVYLSAEERERASSLSRGIKRCQTLFAAGEDCAEVLRTALRNTMREVGVDVEYADIIHPQTLEPLQIAVAGALCIVAARVGSTRLIDNGFLRV